MSCWSAHKSLLWRYLHRSLFLRFILERKQALEVLFVVHYPSA